MSAKQIITDLSIDVHGNQFTQAGLLPVSLRTPQGRSLKAEMNRRTPKYGLRRFIAALELKFFRWASITDSSRVTP